MNPKHHRVELRTRFNTRWYPNRRGRDRIGYKRHLAADPVRQAADRISGEIAAALNGKPKGEVAPLRR